MHCPSCGSVAGEEAKFCRSCGSVLVQQPEAGPAGDGGPLVGFSPKIDDPAFARHLRRLNRSAVIFALILALGFIVGFYIAGEAGTEMDNPQSLYIGLALAGGALLSAALVTLARKRSKTWDGTVEDKRVQKKSTIREDSQGGSYSDDYYIYTVVIRGDDGKIHRLKTAKSDLFHSYFQIGDRVRHHAGFKTYEKYDKSGDDYILCIVCNRVCDISGDYCPRCQSPLLKC